MVRKNDFRRKIHHPWPIADFSIGGKGFKYVQKFSIGIDPLETEMFFITKHNDVKLQ